MKTDALPPDDDTVIWRYMDLARFVSTLSTGRLWFAKMATLRDDPYEGFSKVLGFKVPIGDNSPKLITQETGDGKRTNVSVGQMMEGISQGSTRIVENAQNHLYVNSWCLGELESMAMWEIYGSQGTGVAVKSSIARYIRAARFEVPAQQYTFGEVTYHDNLDSAVALQLDFRESVPAPGFGLWGKLLTTAMHKRSCFQHEREWRAVMYQDDFPEVSGLCGDFDLGQLVSAVHVGPRAQSFVVDAVSSLMSKFELAKPVIASPLLSSPQRNRAAAKG